ncbi:hypothetical protein [Ruegeria hyattellae]|uniref:hypothetical protein n=1 Tax=Ruegeria hyattellae TaxID=3233337 RepID=UPI00355B14E4
MKCHPRLGYFLLAMLSAIGVPGAAQAEPDPATETMAAVDAWFDHDWSVSLSLSRASPRVLRPGVPTELLLEARFSGPQTGTDLYVLIFAAHQGAPLIEIREIEEEPKDSQDKFPAASVHTEEIDVVGPVVLTNADTGKLVLTLFRVATKVLRAAIIEAADEGLAPLVGVRMSDTSHVSPVILSLQGLRRSFKTFVKGRDDRVAGQASEAVSLSPQVAYFTLVRLSGPGPDTDGVVRRKIGLRAPNLPVHYSGILILPAEITQFGSDRRIGIDTAASPPLVIPVVGQERPDVLGEMLAKKRQEERGDLPAVSHNLTIAADRTPVAAGRPVRRAFEVRHGPLQEGADIYVALLPVNAEDGVVFGLGGRETLRGEIDDLAYSMQACRGDPAAGMMQIRQSPIVVASPFPIAPGFEAGRLGAVTSLSGGTVAGRIDFVAPPLAAWYDAVLAVPLVVDWNLEEGQQCAHLEFGSDAREYIPLLGR